MPRQLDPPPPNTSTADAPPPRFRGAQYVRMSTEHQQYSTENQADKLQDYAEKRGIDIVRTYEDSGKSGLSIDGRASLQKLIADVELGAADFSLVLAYNVNRAYSLPLLSHSIHLTYPPPSAFMPSPQNSEM